MAIRIGVIGTGVMGAGHALMLGSQIAGCEVVAVADADQARAKAVAQRVGAARVFSDGKALIADAGIDAVVIASPDPTHHPLVLECLRQVKPVLCEKPLGSNSAECLEIVAAEDKAGRRLVQVGFMRRFDPGYEAMKAAVEEERYGLPLFLHCVHRNAVAASYTTSEAIILNTAVHELDAARFLLGEEFASATVRGARASRSAPSRTPQFLLLETVSGVLVDIEAFVDAQYGYDIRAELVCENGAMTLAQTHALRTFSAGMVGGSLHADWMGRFDDAYRRELQAWVASIGNGGAVGASAWDGYVATRTAELCLQAYRARQTVRIDIEARPALYA